MFRRLFRGNKFLKNMNTLMEIYACSHNTEATYRELLKLETMVTTAGERALFDLNKASLLYDMKQFKQSADIVLEIAPLNPEFDAQCAQLKTKIMNAF